MKLHFIAIGGAIMHQLAIVSSEKGFSVSGSDDEINDPARTNLQTAHLLPPAIGWFPERITRDLDAVILGMHARPDNPELLRAQELQIPVYSFPEYIYELSKDKKRVVVAGSHGKTTTTSIVMHVLKEQGIDFDFLVGARVTGFAHSVRLSDAPLMIIEGDEYPASALEQRPKIHFYYPHIAVLTGIAWDHVNVFPTFDRYVNQFKIFIEQMDEGSTLIYNAEDTEVVRLIENESEKFNLLPYATPSYQLKNDTVTLIATEGNIPLQLFGDHNLQNLEAARKVCNSLGVSDYEFYKSVSDFKGAARRLEQISETDQLVVFRDFAHAPSKLAATLNAVRKHYSNHFLIACFELHTYSSLRQDFLSQYSDTMDNCDSGAIFYSEDALKLKKLPALAADEVKKDFNNQDLAIFRDNDALRKWITTQIQLSTKPVCLLLMSSGNFDGMDIAF